MNGMMNICRKYFGVSNMVAAKILNSMLASLLWPVLFFSLLFYSQCVTGADACNGDPELDPQRDCLPFEDGNALQDDVNAPFFGPDAPPANACEVSGEGTEQNPYKICDYWALARIGSSRGDALPLDKVYRLTADIDASVTCGSNGCEEPAPEDPGAKPIGSLQQPFKGKFYGGRHSIRNLYINRAGLEGIGLFGALGPGAKVEELSIAHAVVRGRMQVGVLAGFNNGGQIKKLTLENVSVYGAQAKVGALVGVNGGDGEIINSRLSSGTVTGAGKVGGLVGENKDDSVIQGSSVGSAVTVGATNDAAGGLVGENGGSAKIENSYADASVNGRDDVGGLVGYDRSSARPSSIELSYSRGSIRASGQNIGGLAGRQSASIIKKSYAKASVQGPEGDTYAPSAVGGLVGYSNAASRIEQSYAAGRRIYGNSRVGGLVGFLQGGVVSDSHTGYHAGSEAAGMLVEGEGNAVGGLLGHMSGNGARLEKSYSAVYLVRGVGGSRKIGGLVGHLEQGSVQKSFSASEVDSSRGQVYVGGLIGHCQASSLSSIYFRNTLDAFGRPSDCYTAEGELPSGVSSTNVQFLLSGLLESSVRHLAWDAESSPWARLNQVGAYPCLSALHSPDEGSSGGCSTSSDALVPVQAWPSEYVNNLRVEGGAEDGNYTLTWSSLRDSSIRYMLEQRVEDGPYQPLTAANAETSWPIVGQDYGTYSYRVRACYGVDSCNPSANPSNITTLRVTSIPVLELSLGAKDHADNSYVISWNRLDGSIVRYEWAERSDNAWPSRIEATGSINAQRLSEAGEGIAVERQKGGPLTYYYKVRACGIVSGECGDWSDTLWVRVDLPALETFSEERPSDCGSEGAGTDAERSRSLRVEGGVAACYDGSFKLHWNAVGREDVSRYEVQERLQSESWEDEEGCQESSGCYNVNSRSSSQLPISEKSAGTYVYRIRPCGELGCSSSWSNEEELVVPELAVPASFSSNKDVSYDGIYTLTWGSVANASHYIIRESERANNEDPWTSSRDDITIDGASLPEKEFSGKMGEGGKSYKYEIQACNQSNCSLPSEISEIIVRVSPLDAVRGFKSSTYTVNVRGYELDWSLVAAAQSYELQELKLESKLGAGQSLDWDSGSSSIRTLGTDGVVSGTSYDIASDNSGSSEPVGVYYYRVRPCVSSSACGDWSELPSPVEVRSLSVAWKKVLGALQEEEEEEEEDSVSSVYHLYKFPSETVAAYVVSWDSVPGANVYYLQKSSGDDGAWSYINDTEGSPKSFEGTEFSSEFRGSDDNIQRYKLEACAAAPRVNCVQGSEELVLHGHIVTAPSSLSFVDPSVSPGANGVYPVEYGLPYRIEWASVSYPGLNYTYFVEESFDGSLLGKRSVGKSDYWSSGESAKDVGAYVYRVQLCMGPGRCTPYSSSIRVSVQAGQQNFRSSVAETFSGIYVIAWNPVPSAFRYVLQESIDGGLSWLTIVRDSVNRARTQQSFSSSNNLTGHRHGFGNSYRYQVKACTGPEEESCGDWTTSAELVRIILGIPGNFSSDKGDNIFDGNYDINWDTVYGAERYEVQEKIEGGKIASPVYRDSDRDLESSPSSSHPLSNKAGDGRYSYRVRACVGSEGVNEHCGDWSADPASASVSVDVTLPTPRRLRSDENPSSNGQYRVSWDPLSGYSYSILYELEETGPASGVNVYNVGSNSYKEITKTVDGNADYDYRVRACSNSVGCAPYAPSSALTVAVREAPAPVAPVESPPSLESDVDDSDGFLDEEGFAGGSGTEADPYLIANYGQLNNMRDSLTAHYALSNNIDARASWSEGADGCVAYDGSAVPASNACRGWVPVGSDSDFSGSLDGRGFVISNLYVNVSGSDGQNAYAGLFGRIASGVDIRDVGLVNVNINVSSASRVSYGGALAGLSRGGAISNSYAAGAVSSSAYYNSYGGGLVGYNNNGTISSSYATGSVSSSSSSTNYHSSGGGLVGYNSSGTISNSYVEGDVSSSAPSQGTASAGGLVGHNLAGTISNSYAAGAVSSSSYHNSYGGGLVGQSEALYNAGAVSNSYAAGLVSCISGQTCSNPKFGGLIGKNSVTINGTNYFVDASGANNGVAEGSCSSESCLQASGANNSVRRAWLENSLDETSLGWDSQLDEDGNAVWGNLNAAGFPCLRNMPSGAPRCN